MKKTAATALAMLALAVAFTGVVRAACLCDDAYITLRTIDNWVHGYGLRWNIGERVQTYTHPLWMFLLSSVYYFTREPYYTTLAVCLVATAATLLLVAFVLPPSREFGALGVIVLASSHAFTTYSTTGFENSLANLLLVIFVLELDRQAAPAQLQRLTFVAALLCLTRQDFVLLVGPAILVELAVLRSRAAARALVIGGLPIIAWELFSFYYYGALVPNTAAAKLHHHVARGVVLAQGFRWLGFTLKNDWSTALVVLWAAIVALWRRERALLWGLFGVLLYLGYCCAIGGDYSAGRLWVAPMVFSLALLMRRIDNKVAVGLGVIALSTLFLGVRPVAFGGDPDRGLPPSRGVWDDPAFYFPQTGLIHNGLHARGPLFDWGRWGEAESKKPDHVVEFHAIGQYGYYAGPHVHVVDDIGLGDPLLARLAPKAVGALTPGHLRRAIPDGYLQSLDGHGGGVNVIRDPALHQFYDVIVEVTRGPLWSWSRLNKALRLSWGCYQPLVDRYENPPR